MAKNYFSTQTARDGLKKGVDALADAVKVTIYWLREEMSY